ncbi:MAG: hypothetical protein CME62_16760 [Halobacteriovoraceae bacterium]|nr:hypothetical protein [Halobacteriovoraceae bacterium]|tara:strand:- start:11116 stop:11400 length:285 start_codon:yes stop_codon:yes gene_type:complete
MSRKYAISEKDYIEKKLEVAKNLLPTMVGQQTEAYVQDPRKRESLIYNCVAISDHLLREIGFCVSGSQAREATDIHNKTAIRKLSEMLNEDKKK